MQQLQTRALVGSKHRELREEPWEGLPPRPPLRVICTGAGKHPCQMVTTLGESTTGGAVSDVGVSVERDDENKTTIAESNKNKCNGFEGKKVSH